MSTEGDRFIEEQAQAWAEIPELTKLAEPIPETVNGPGATLAVTAALREALPDLLRRHEIRSVLDIGCGDWNWMSHVDLGDVAYLGWDVDAATIARNQESYGQRANVAFGAVNILTAESVPRVDLVLARHVLIHFPNEYTCAVLGKLRASGSRFLLTSTWPGTENAEYEPEGFAYRGYVERTVNLEAAPFGMAPPVEMIHEPAAEQGVLRDAHELALYELADAPEGVHGVNTGPCEHGSHYKVHRADGTVQTKCSSCHTLIDESAEPDEGFSLMGTFSRWQRRVAADDEPEPPDAKVTVTDPQSGLTRIVPGARGRTSTARGRLAILRDNHREAVEAARAGDSLQAAWLLIGVQAAAIDAILAELTGDD